MRLLYGTTNPAKLSSMKQVLDKLSIDMIGLRDLNTRIPEVEETGNDPLENAVLKAHAYYDTFHLPVFSCDSGLYFRDLSPDLQPGPHTRRVGGRSLNDEEMTAYYANLARIHGGLLTGRYKNAICLILDPEHIYQSIDESLWTEPFLLTDTPHSKRVPGYPLDRLSLDIATRKYYYDLPDRVVDSSAVHTGYYQFFRAHCHPEHR